jgi:hypothetical protein
MMFGQTAAVAEESDVQALVSLTVSESKRLIAKAVPEMPQVKEAMKNGMVILTKGTTNTYVAEEFIGEPIERGALVYGRVYPEKGAKKLSPDSVISELIFIKGERQHDLSLADAVKKLQKGDVVIKGGNALDYKSKLAAVYIGGGSAGTTGKFMPYLVGQKARLIIPIGLEKNIAGDIHDAVHKMRQPVQSLNRVPSMWLLDGELLTEIEAFKILAHVTATHVSSGGIGGAEGGVRLLLRGSRKNVEHALKIVEEILGEPPFVE